MLSAVSLQGSQKAERSLSHPTHNLSLTWAPLLGKRTLFLLRLLGAINFMSSDSGMPATVFAGCRDTPLPQPFNSRPRHGLHRGPRRLAPSPGFHSPRGICSLPVMNMLFTNTHEAYRALGTYWLPTVSLIWRLRFLVLEAPRR